ncbi:hypothetical protein OSTOST_17914 [Ostertagia ostertagi]
MVVLNVPEDVLQQSLTESLFNTFGLVLLPGTVAVLWYVLNGSLSCFVHISVCFGSAVAAVLSLDFLLGGQNAWGWLLFAPAILGAAQIVANSYIPETPNYYLQNGFYIQAIDSIKFYYDISYDDDDEAIQEYWDMVPEVAFLVAKASPFHSSESV